MAAHGRADQIDFYAAKLIKYFIMPKFPHKKISYLMIIF